MPSYFDELEKLGSIPFYHKRYKTKRGSSVEFVDVLRVFHKSRTKTLLEQGWITHPHGMGQYL